MLFIERMLLGVTDDMDNNLIGIRERTLIKENETKGKYKPAIINGKMFNHPLGFNFFNLKYYIIYNIV